MKKEQEINRRLLAVAKDALAELGRLGAEDNFPNPVVKELRAAIAAAEKRERKERK